MASIVNNLKATKTLGLTLPPTLLATEDEVIEREQRLPELADIVAKVESCNGLNFWREREARRDR